MNSSKIPVCEPCLETQERKHLLKAFDSGWISSKGNYINYFEEKFSQYCGSKFGITTSSGTTAIHLALIAAGIKPNDEVILPDFTMIATLSAVLYCQAKPVFVNVEPDTGNIDTNKIKAKITKKTKAIIPVHIYGHPVDMQPLLKLAKKHHLLVIEDAAEAHGAEYKGKKCGSLGNLGCFSFYANKIITTGEGGMVITSNKQLADKCRYYKNLCFPLSGKRDYFHHDLGFNYRMTNLQAAIGAAQLRKISTLINQRRANAKFYNLLLKDIPGIQLPVEKPYAKNVYWMYGIVINSKKFGKTKEQLKKYLQKEGVDTRDYFQPLHTQPLLKKLGIKTPGSYPQTQYLAKNGLLLPSGPNLKKKEISYICNCIKKFKGNS